MSSPPMQLRPDEIDTVEKRGRYTVSIVGCGQTGLLHAVLFAQAGFRTVCADTDQAVVGNIAKGKAKDLREEQEAELKKLVKTKRITVTNDIQQAVSQSELILIAIPVRIDAKQKADYGSVDNACKQIGSSLRRGSLVIVTSLTGINVTESRIKDILENTSALKAGTDFSLAYSPQLTSQGQASQAGNERRIVAATDNNSMNAAATVLESVAKNVVTKSGQARAAELAALLKALRGGVDAAVTNEVTFFCEKSGIDYLEVQKLLTTDENNLSPSSMFSDEHVCRGPYLLLEDAEGSGIKLRVLEIAVEINENIADHAVHLVKDALRSCGKTLRRSKISLLGVSQDPNLKAPPKRAAKEIIKRLETKGARVSVYDPFIPPIELSEVHAHLSKNLTKAIEGSDCLIILTGHDQFKRLNLKRLKVLMKMPAAMVDLDWAVEPDKVEKADLIYRGLGRGVWTK
jgi:nucleotide sugar dehydrogenase